MAKMAKLELNLDEKLRLQILAKLLVETIESRVFAMNLKNGKKYVGYIDFISAKSTPYSDIWDNKKVQIIYGIDPNSRIVVNLSDIVGISLSQSEQDYENAFQDK